MRSMILSFLAIAAVAVTLPAQSPMPVIVPAMTPATTAKVQAPAPENSASLQAAVKILEQIKAANEETLKKQVATLEQLAQLEKAAEQIKIYTKRS